MKLGNCAWLEPGRRPDRRQGAPGPFLPDNSLKNAPHTAAELVGEWPHGYSREQAVYPVASLMEVYQDA